MHGDGKLTCPHPLPHQLYPSPSVCIRYGFHPHPSPQHLTSTLPSSPLQCRSPLQCTFYRLSAFPDAQLPVSKHWRLNTLLLWAQIFFNNNNNDTNVDYCRHLSNSGNMQQCCRLTTQNQRIQHVFHICLIVSYSKGYPSKKLTKNFSTEENSSFEQLCDLKD